jgi:hypothetical protein
MEHQDAATGRFAEDATVLHEVRLDAPIDTGVLEEVQSDLLPDFALLLELEYL